MRLGDVLDELYGEAPTILKRIIETYCARGERSFDNVQVSEEFKQAVRDRASECINTKNDVTTYILIGGGALLLLLLLKG